jgi:hypothetical protein
MIPYMGANRQHLAKIWVKNEEVDEKLDELQRIPG